MVEDEGIPTQLQKYGGGVSQALQQGAVDDAEDLLGPGPVLPRGKDKARLCGVRFDTPCKQRSARRTRFRSGSSVGRRLKGGGHPAIEGKECQLLGERGGGLRPAAAAHGILRQ